MFLIYSWERVYIFIYPLCTNILTLKNFHEVKVRVYIYIYIFGRWVGYGYHPIMYFILREIIKGNNIGKYEVPKIKLLV
jgi:hypothetical protein